MAHGFKPRSGSLAFYPRKKANRIYPKIKTVKKFDNATLTAFAGWKAGMTYVMATDNYDKSPSYGHKINIPVSILECPPLSVFAIRAYSKGNCVSQVYAEKIDKDLARVIKVPKKANKQNNAKKIEAMLSEIDDVRLVVHTQPRKTKLKKTPEIFEIPVTGKIEEAWKKANELLGKEIKVSEFFAAGDFIDVVGITKGKGTQGPVKIYGIKIQIRKNKKHRRMPGSIGGLTPSRVFRTVAQKGQLGFQRRTEYNTRILKISDRPEEIKISGGIPHYGEVYSDFILIQGSIPGIKKRLVVIRKALRSNKPKPVPEIQKIGIESQQ